MQTSLSSAAGQRAPGAFNPITVTSLSISPSIPASISTSTSAPTSTSPPTSASTSTSTPPSLVPPSQTTQQLREVVSIDSEPISPTTLGTAFRLRGNAATPHNVLPDRPSAQSSQSFHDSRYPILTSSSTNANFAHQSSTPSIQPSEALRASSPLRFPPKPLNDIRVQQRRHAHSQGFFEPSLPTTSHLNSIPSGGSSGVMEPPPSQHPGLSASQIAAQAAMQHQNQNHQRKRSQTLPLENAYGQRRPSRGPVSPPLLSLTEASGERHSGFGAPPGALGPAQVGQVYRNGLLAGSVNPAATAANVVFARSPQTSPNLSTVETTQQQQQYREPEKPVKPEKSKVKLFSRSGKLPGLGKEKDSKEKPLGSPSKLAFGNHQLQSANLSTHNLVDSTMSGASSMYSLGNSSSATIRAIDTSAAPSIVEKEQGKEKKHHFLSRQKQKLSGKDDHHLPLSSANSNSRPVDPHAPSSFYNFNVPPSPGPAATSFSKSMSGLDLRHGGRALREKKREEKSAANHSFQESSLRESETSGDWPGPSSLGSTSGLSPYLGLPNTAYANSIYGGDLQDFARYGLNNMSPDDAWPLLKSKLFAVFQGEDLRLPIEDFNRLVSTHIQRCIVKRAPNIIIDDLRDLLTTGFLSIDATLRRTSDERLIPHLVEMWLFVFTSVLPYLQAVFLPLDLEFEGQGPLMSQAAAREFWGALPISSLSNGSNNPTPVPAHHLLSIRRLVLTTYRDIVILPRYELLQTIFSRLSLESINFPSPSPINTSSLSTSPPDLRPGTAMSLDPAFSSYSSQSTTLLNGSGTGSDSVGARSRGVSNVSFDQRETVYPQTQSLNSRSHTPNIMVAGGGLGISGSSIGATSSQREVNAEDSKHVTDTVGRMLQCMSILSAVGVIPGDGSEVKAQREAAAASGGTGGRARGYSTGMVEDEVAQEKMDRLCRALKLNWLGRGRVGRNRRGLVGERTKITIPIVDVGT